MSSAYIDLLKKSLIDYGNIGKDELHELNQVPHTWKVTLLKLLSRLLEQRQFRIHKVKPVTRENRLNGYDWPSQAKTMVGLNRLNHVEQCITEIGKHNVAGDFVEAGVWRGGVTILMAALMKELDLQQRSVWALDSFQGMPAKETLNHQKDQQSHLHREPFLCVPLEEVKANFEEYGLLSGRVKFVKGWFQDSLPNLDIGPISLLRIDADFYESTLCVLNNLYNKVSVGGFVIIDDYNAFDYCKEAVDHFRTRNNISQPIVEIDNEAVYWKIDG